MVEESSRHSRLTGGAGRPYYSPSHGRPPPSRRGAGPPGIARSAGEQPHVPRHLAPRRNPAPDRRFHVLRPRPLPAPTLPPDFDGVGRAQARADFATTTRPLSGHGGARRAAAWVRGSSSQYGLRTERERFHAKIPGRGSVPLENLLAFPDGPTRTRSIVVVAHRDNSGASPARTTTRSGHRGAARAGARRTRAQRAAAAAGARSTRSCSCRRTAARFGGLGAAHFAAFPVQGPRSSRSSTSTRSRAQGRPHLVFAGDARARPAGRSSARPPRGSPSRPDAGQPRRARSRSCSISPSRSASTSRRRSSARASPAITLTSAGDRPPPAVRRHPRSG